MSSCRWRDSTGAAPAYWPRCSFLACMQVQQNTFAGPERCHSHGLTARQTWCHHHQPRLVVGYWPDIAHVPSPFSSLRPRGTYYTGPVAGGSSAYFCCCKLRARRQTVRWVHRGRRCGEMDGCEAIAAPVSLSNGLPYGSGAMLIRCGRLWRRFVGHLGSEGDLSAPGYFFCGQCTLGLCRGCYETR